MNWPRQKSGIKQGQEKLKKAKTMLTYGKGWNGEFPMSNVIALSTGLKELKVRSLELCRIF